MLQEQLVLIPFLSFTHYELRAILLSVLSDWLSVFKMSNENLGKLPNVY